MGASPPGPGKISSSLFKVSSASVISVARKADSNCSIVRGPMMGAVTMGLCKSPGQGHGSWRFAQLLAQGLVLFQLGPVFVNFLEGLLTHASAALQLLKGSAQEAAPQGAPRDQSQAVVPAGGDYLQLHRAVVEMVDTLFAA